MNHRRDKTALGSASGSSTGSGGVEDVAWYVRAVVDGSHAYIPLPLRNRYSAFRSLNSLSNAFV